MFLFRKKPKHTAEEIEEINARYEAEYQARHEAIDRIEKEVADAVERAHKPERCNTVKSSVEGGDFFGFKNTAWGLHDWEVWRYDEKLWFYSSQVNNTPAAVQAGLFHMLPALCCIDISDIQYFRIEGAVVSETKVTGGKVTQNGRRISQTPIKTKTTSRDERCVRLVARRDGVVYPIEFFMSSYDVLFSLIPEKEYNRVVKG